MPIKFRLKELIAERERKKGQKVTYQNISEATGISTNTITQVANQKVKNIGLNTVYKLCTFFNCQPGDLLILEIPSQ